MYQDKRLGSHEVIMRNSGRAAMINSYFRRSNTASSTAKPRSWSCRGRAIDDWSRAQTS